MDLLVLGAAGLLGSNVVAAGRRRGAHVAGTYHRTVPGFDVPTRRFDLRDHDDFDDLLDWVDPDAVVNCAAVTDVDACERALDRAHEVNGTAPGAMAAACDRRGIDFVHVSTDYVFDGTARTPYDETAATNPIQVYGASKAAGERAVRERSDSALVTRLSFVWGIHADERELTGFPAWLRESLRRDGPVPLFADQWITPSRAGGAAGTLLDLLAASATGCYHVASRSCTTPHAFGSLFLDAFSADPDSIVEGSLADVDREAARPTYTCLDVGRVESRLGRPQPTVRADVGAVRDRL